MDKKHNKVISIKAVIALLFLVLLLILFFNIFVSCNANFHSSRKLSDYSQCIGRTHLWSCIMFPDQKLLSADNCEFYDLYWHDGYNTPEYLTYVRCSFDRETFDKEILRLSILATEYSEDLFERPAYILCLNSVGLREYALVDETNQRINYYSSSTKRFLNNIPSEDRLKPEYSSVIIHADYESLESMP